MKTGTSKRAERVPRADEFEVVGTVLDAALGLCRLQTAGTNSRIARCVSRVSSVPMMSF